MKVAKAVIIDDSGKYLLLYRADHPVFGTDPDLPGGIVEPYETPLQGAVREVREEIGLDIRPDQLVELYTGTGYSAHGTYRAVYAADVGPRPAVTLSWEHSSSEWLDREDFLRAAVGANDNFMHMVADILRKTAVRR